MPDTERRYCGNKICYSEREANQVLHDCRYNTNYRGRCNSRRKSANKTIPKRKYYCEKCGMYHLTHLSHYKE